MKIFDLFTKLFSVFAYLTLGSLLIMVGMRVIDWQDLVSDLGRIYESPQAAFQTMLIGIIFIFMGLAFAKILIKQTRYAGGIVYTGPMGRTTVSVSAIEDVVRKALKKFPEIFTYSLKCRGYEKKAELKIKMIVHENVVLPRLNEDIKKEVLSRLARVLGLAKNDVELYLDIRNIKETEPYEAASASTQAS